MTSASLKLGANILGRSNGQLLSINSKMFQVQAAWISGKALRTEDRKREKPWPYKTKGFKNYHNLFDSTYKRFDDNTKVILVEGPPATGKSELAKALAEELEMEYFPMVTMDMWYINPYGYDLRQLDPIVPKNMLSFDEKRFIREPNHQHSILFQCNKLILKTHQYIDALAHILNTGQGIVLDRSLYSDCVFIEAMYKCGYVSKVEMKAYYEYYEAAKKLLMKPHLVLYLDAPVDVVTENLKKRGQGEEKTLTPQFLETMEETYKLQFLREMETHAELLVYDWSEKGDVEVIVEDIERINYEAFEEDIHNPKMKDWRIRKDEDMGTKRWEYTNLKGTIMTSIYHIDVSHIPALCEADEDVKAYEEILDEAPGMRYEYGFNADMGDSVLFKTKHLPGLLGQRIPRF